MSISYIRKYLVYKVGAPVVVIYHGCRNKNERYAGILYRVYNNIFAVKLQNNEIKTFSLVDILTKTIQLYI